MFGIKRCILWLGLVLVTYISYICKALLHLINILHAPTVPKLPNELLVEIPAYTVASDVPLRLEEFIELGKSHRERGVTRESPALSYHLFHEKLHPSQQEHYLHWLAINGTSRNFRECGKEAFFSGKIFIISPTLLKDLQDGSCKNMSASDKAAIFSDALHVIVPLRHASVQTQFSKMPMYNAFRKEKKQKLILSIQPLAPYNLVGDPDLYPPALETASTPTASQPMADGYELFRALQMGIPKRHPAPEDLLDLLAGMHLQVGRMKVDLLHRDTEMWRLYVIDKLDNQVYYYLRFLIRIRLGSDGRSRVLASA